MNKNLFKTQKPLPQVNTVNEAGGVAFKLSDKAALAKLVTVGTISNTFHVSAESQLKQIIDLSQKVPASFIAQLAMYARTESFLKDTPALLCAILANRDVTLLKTIFNDVIDNGKMLKNFVQTIRSGVVGRKSFGTAIKKLIQKWFDNRSDYALFKDSIGNNHSLADVIKMVHPSPKTETKEALYAYIIGKEVVKSKSDMKKDQHGRYTTVLFTKLPEIVQEYELYKEAILNGKNVEKVPNVDFQMITALPLKENHWKEIAKQMPFHAARMNLNTMVRHKAFDDKSVVDKVIKTLTDEEQIKKMKVYPYQLLAAYKNATDIPNSISNALQDALEISTQNIPKFNVENIVVLTDSSGSMTSSVTNNGKVPSKVNCIDVASLFASCILRKNDNAQIFAFDTATYKINLNSRDSVMTNASKINKGGGGTDVGQALRYVANNIKKVDVIFIISDNMSWFNTGNGYYHGTTDAQIEWNKIKKQNPNAKIVLLDIQPNSSTQINEDKSVLNCSGFSDNVFKIVKSFVDGSNSDDHFVKEIEKIDISIKNETKDEQIKKLVESVSNKVKRDKSGKFTK